MPSYKVELRTDQKGVWCRSLGRKVGENGKTKPHLFRFGRERAVAQDRLARLSDLWNQIESEAKTPEAALWSIFTLEMGKAIAKGETVYRMPFPHVAEPSDEDYRAYAYLVDTHASSYRMIAVLPDDTEAYRRGKEVTGQKMAAFVREAEKVFHVPNVLEAETKTFHQAMDEYGEYLKKTYIDPTTRKTKPWGNTQSKQAGRIKERQSNDFPLHQLTLQKIKDIIETWRSRPIVKDGTTPITPSTAKNHIKQFKHFLWWLHDSDDFRWKMPPEVERLSTKPHVGGEEKARRSRPDQVKTFTLEELVIFYKYATPLVRLYVLLGLNCGFGPAEFGTLRLDEIFLHQRHGHDDLINYQTTAEMSWIKRGRRKTGVYGEWLLWPETVEGIEWALEIRKKKPDFRPDALLCLTERGLPYHGQTSGGNNNSRIGNAWWRTVDRIQEDKKQYRRLSPKLLRKTSGNKVRDIKDGEVMAIFHSRGDAVETDDLADFYSNRPFRKVFEAIQEMHEWLHPMFEAVDTPFPKTVKKGGSNITLGQIERIRELHQQGMKPPDIASEVGVSAATVYRRISEQKPG